MSRPRLHLLAALLAALCLLGAQQAAYAHVLSHLLADGAVAQSNGDGGDAADVLHHACETCAAFATLAAAPPVCIVPPALAAAAPIQAAAAVSAYFPAPPAPPYASRAPPAVL